MFKKLTKKDREEILASRIGFLPMSAIEATIFAHLKQRMRFQKEPQVNKANDELSKKNKTKAAK